MNNLRIGMYVETKLHYIRKIIKVIENYEEFDVYEVDKEFRESENYESTEILYPDEVVKSSDNLIDLIEVGDYVNGFKVASVDKGKYSVFIEEPKDYVWQCLWNEDIKSIVTKEQFESISYKIKEKEE